MRKGSLTLYTSRQEIHDESETALSMLGTGSDGGWIVIRGGMSLVSGRGIATGGAWCTSRALGKWALGGTCTAPVSGSECPEGG